MLEGWKDGRIEWCGIVCVCVCVFCEEKGKSESKSDGVLGCVSQGCLLLCEWIGHPRGLPCGHISQDLLLPCHLGGCSKPVLKDA